MGRDGGRRWMRRGRACVRGVACRHDTAVNRADSMAGTVWFGITIGLTISNKGERQGRASGGAGW